MPLSGDAINARKVKSEPQRASVNLYMNDADHTLWIRIKPNSKHYRELMVYRPDGTSVILVLDDIFISPPLKDFSSQLEFDFPAHKLIGQYWDEG